MKKEMYFALFLFAGFPLAAFSATGYANDGFVLALFLGCFLLLIAGVFEGIDFLNRHWKTIFQRVRDFIRKKEDNCRKMLTPELK